MDKQENLHKLWKWHTTYLPEGTVLVIHADFGSKIRGIVADFIAVDTRKKE